MDLLVNIDALALGAHRSGRQRTPLDDQAWRTFLPLIFLSRAARGGVPSHAAWGIPRARPDNCAGLPVRGTGPSVRGRQGTIALRGGGARFGWDSPGRDQDRLCGVRRAPWSTGRYGRADCWRVRVRSARDRGHARVRYGAADGGITGGVAQHGDPAVAFRRPRYWRVQAVSPSPAGTPSGGALRYAAVDSIAGDSLRVGRADARWVFDQSLGAPPAPPVVASDGATVVAPGGMSGPRMVGVAVPRAVTAFRVTLYGSGTNVFTVPVAAPDQVPLEELEDSRAPDNIVTNDPRIPGARPEQTLASVSRQCVGRAAPGGRRSGAGRRGRGAANRAESVLLPSHSRNPDSGGGPLAAVIRTLAALPQVQHVMPDVVTGPAVPR